jgi:hypothetical protein
MKLTENKTVKDNLSYLVLIGLMIAVLFTGFLFGGCTNSANPLDPAGGNNGSSGESQVSFSTMLEDGITDDPTATLVITEAKALITEVEIEMSDSTRSYRRDMFVIYFNTDGSLQTALSSRMPKGTFKKIKFKVHKPEDFETPPDSDFKIGNSGNQRFSFIVRGTYNGSPFLFRSRKSMNIVLNFATVTNIVNGSSNLTMLVDKMRWFTVNGNLVNPTNSSYEDDIEDNIKNSFRKIFKDDDRNGRPDDN